MADYSQARIYKIVSDQTADVYIGSTIQRLSARIHGHRMSMQGGNYCTSREVMKYDDYRIVLIENYPCDSKEQKLAREYHWMTELRKQGINVVNKQCPGRSKKQYNEDTREQKKVIDKEYYEANRDQILSKNKEYRDVHRDQIAAQTKEYRDANRGQFAAKSKEYRESNREKLSAQKNERYAANREQVLAKIKEYRESNRELIAARKALTFTCGCGSTCRQPDKARHERTMKHSTWAKNTKNQISAPSNEDPTA